MKNIRFFQTLFLLCTFCIALQFSASAQWLQDPATQDIKTNPLFIGMPNAKVVIGNPPPAANGKLLVECNSSATFPTANLFNNTGSASSLRFSNFSNRFWDIKGGFGAAAANDRLSFDHNTLGPILNILGNGNVGIGVIAPTQKLEVAGTTKTTGLQVTSGAVNGYFLKSDAAGNAIWSKPSWTTSGNNQYSSLTGNVGIGTSTPSAKLMIVGNTMPLLSLKSNNTLSSTIQFANNNTGYWNINGLVASGNAGDRLNFANDAAGTILTMTGEGKVGIGTDNPGSALTVASSSSSNAVLELHASTEDRSGQIKFTNGSSSGFWYIDTKLGTTSATDEIYIGNSGGTKLNITGDGNVGIGTNSPDNKLDVCGTIRAKEIKVESSWCDYVFEENYPLRPLAEVEKYILKHRHLPDVTSAADIQKDGLQVAKQMTEMMLKIEELTLYLIEMKKENTETKKENAALKQRIEKLENE